MQNYAITLKEMLDAPSIKDRLTPIYLPEGYESIQIKTANVNRCGMQLTGFFDYFDPGRVQVLGQVEHTYLTSLNAMNREQSLANLFKRKPCCVVCTRNLEFPPELLKMAKQYKIPLLKTAEVTFQFVAGMFLFLNDRMAPRETRHGVLVEVDGEGILILGESGVGKSETAIELVKRGHRLVADDAVEIKRINDHQLVGAAPAIIRHFMELRGIGIVDVKSIFGLGAVKDSAGIDMIIQLEQWQEGKMYDRIGLDNEYMEMLGVQVPYLLLPVKPGRNLAVIIEVAAINNKQKKAGYNAAATLNDRLMANARAELEADS